MPGTAPAASSGMMSNAQSRQSISGVTSRPVSPPPPAADGPSAETRRMSNSSAVDYGGLNSPTSSTASGPASGPPPLQSQQSNSVLGGGNPFLNRRQTEDGTGQSASTAGSLARSFFSRSASQQAQEGGPEPDGEDTMKNLRKTFAGIFGDM